MKKVTFLLILFFDLFMLIMSADAQQPSAPDTAWDQIQIRNAAKLYQQQFSGPNSPVYQGYEYVPYILQVSGDPFFSTNKWQQGSVDFEGMVYRNLSLLYDIMKDQLVLQSPDMQYRILVPPQKVSAFMIGPYHFIRVVRSDSTKNIKPATGYYEQLVTGKVSLLARRMKTINIPTEAGMPRKYVSESNYYIERENKYYKVRTRKSVLKILADQKKTIKRYLRKKDIYFNSDRENAIIQAVKYYDTIKQ